MIPKQAQERIQDLLPDMEDAMDRIREAAEDGEDNGLDEAISVLTGYAVDVRDALDENE